MSEGYTAERLLEVAGKVQKIGDELAKELADTLYVYGYAWQAEVKALRERIAALEAGKLAPTQSMIAAGAERVFDFAQECRDCELAAAEIYRAMTEEM